MKKVGVELENNSSTPMEAVIELNIFVFGQSHSDAFEYMWKIHRKGRGLVAVFPENRLHEIEQRLRSFIDEMEYPVTYKILSELSGGRTFEVDFGSLLDWEDYKEQKAVAKHQRRVWYVVLIVIVVALIPLLLFRLN